MSLGQFALVAQKMSQKVVKKAGEAVTDIEAQVGQVLCGQGGLVVCFFGSCCAGGDGVVFAFALSVRGGCCR